MTSSEAFTGIMPSHRINLRIISDDEKFVQKCKERRDVIEAEWQEALKQKNLTNGSLLHLCRLERSDEVIELQAMLIEYKTYIAHRTHPELGLGVTPVGVSGLSVFFVNGREYVIVAKRSESVATYPGFLELVPSGSIDKKFIREDGTVDFQSQLAEELVEETGLSRESIKQVSDIGVVLDRESNIYDICCKLVLNINREEIITSFSRSSEYGTPEFYDRDELMHLLSERSDRIVPTSKVLIDGYCRSNLTG